ncbi:MAG: hypothetical protein IJZ93_02955 [Clostridia bacterium]|nr:hypothetical protein [Clostridia bacterium]
MIVNPKQTTLAYRCPACGGVVKSFVEIFSLSGNLFRLKCDCGGSYMTVEKTDDKKLRLTLPCLVCSYPHSYVISNSVFFDSDIFIVGCNLSGIDLCFIGKEDQVDEAVRISNEEILAMLGDVDISKLHTQEKEHHALSDPQVLDIVRFVINELNDEGNIHCNCKDKGQICCDIYDEYVIVKCEKCGAKAQVDITSTSRAMDFLEADSLTLK